MEPGELIRSPDPLERARVAHQLIGEHLADIGQLTRIRADALRQAAMKGAKLTDIAEGLGVTKQRVSQMLKADGRPQTGWT